MYEVQLATQDPRMLEILAILEKVAETSSPLLLIGERGTGRKHALRYMLSKTKRYSEPIVHIPTHVLTGDKFKKEILEPGVKHPPKSLAGYLEMAHTGTLLLENIDSITPENQQILLEAITNRKIRRIDSKDEIQIDSRFVFTTSKKLEELVAKGDFREDLYYRINVIPIVLPPLRDRGNDIELLTMHFLSEIAKYSYSRVEYNCQPEVIDAMKQYHWPGNITELLNELTRAFYHNKGQITVDVISRHILEAKTSDFEKIQQKEFKSDQNWFISTPHWQGRGIKTKRDYCFVLMPFSESWSDDVWQIIKDSVRELGFNCERSDERAGRVVMEDIWAGINAANLIVADLTAENPNVTYEVGMADVIGKEVILLTQKVDKIPFDFLGQRLIIYENSLAGAKKLKEELQARIGLIFPYL